MRGIGRALSAGLFLAATAMGALAKDIQLDLAGKVNRAFVDETGGDGLGGWTDQGPENSLRGLKPGVFSFNGTDFTILNEAAAGGNQVMVFHSKNNRTDLKSAEIPVEAAGQGGALYLLHTGGWIPFSSSERAGSIEVVFAAGRTQKFDVVANRDIGDWWSPTALENAAVAYRENNGAAEVGLYVSRFSLSAENGNPVSVKFTNGDGPVWLVVAATLSAEDRPLPEPEKWVATSGENWREVGRRDVEVKSGTALDLTQLFPPAGEAGEHGFVVVNEEGQLAFESKLDEPLRLFCASIGMMPGFTLSGQAIERYADQVARAGYNAFRPHFLDTMLMRGSTEELEFNPEQLDRWDRLSAALKKRGIYLYMDAITSWAGYYPEQQIGTPEAKAHRLRSRIYYDEKARAHWEAGVRKLFTHVNPYTGVALKDEPQVAIVQLRNESGLNFLMHLDDSRDPGILEPFRAWLKKRYETTEALSKGWTKKEGDARVSYLKYGVTIDTVELPPLRGNGPDTRDLQEFFVDIERDTYHWMAEVAREIGIRAPLTEYNNGYSIQAALARDVVQVVDSHAYFDHPRPAPQSTITGGSAVANGLSHFRAMAGTRHWGRPFLCSEWGHCFWSPTRYEAGVTLPAYASLQGWQMLTQHANPVRLYSAETVRPFFVGDDLPLKAGEYMAALLYRRGDVRESQRRIEVRINPDELEKNGLQLQNALPASVTRLGLVAGLGLRVANWSGAAPRAETKADWSFSPGEVEDVQTMQGAQMVKENQSADILELAVAALRRNGILAGENRTDVAGGIFEADTGELLLNEKEGTIRVITERSEAGVLTETAPSFELPNLTAERRDANATVFAGSLTDEPLRKSGKILFILATDALNSGMTFSSEKRLKMLEPGTAPVLVKTASITFSLRHDFPRSLRMWALREDGTRANEITLIPDDSAIRGEIDTAGLASGPTPYFEIALEDEN